MNANRLLIRWNFGWHEVTDCTGFTADMFEGENIFNEAMWLDAPVIREAMLSLGSSQERTSMVAVARHQLGIFADPRTEIACDVAPINDGDTPYLAYRPGDKVIVPDMAGNPVTEQVRAITVTEDDDGVVSYAVELKDLILTDQERWQTALDKMASGSVAGQSKAASPVTASYVGMGHDCCPPPPPPATCL